MTDPVHTHNQYCCVGVQFSLFTFCLYCLHVNLHATTHTNTEIDELFTKSKKKAQPQTLTPPTHTHTHRGPEKNRDG